MSLTRFAVIASELGLVASWALLAATAVVAIESPALLISLFLGIFPAFFAAVWSHPKRDIQGTHVSVSWPEVFASAPVWASVLVVCSLAAMFAAVAMVPEFRSGGESSFSITRAALTGRPDRARCCLAFFAAFYAISLHTALSARALRAKLGLPWMPP
jgi:hypothetical protein